MPLPDETKLSPGQMPWTAVRRAQALLRLTALSLALVSMVLCGFFWMFQMLGIGDRNGVTGQDPFFYFLFTYEPQMLAASSGGFLALYLLMRRPEWFSFVTRILPWPRTFTTAQLTGLSLFVFGLVGLGRHFVFRDYDCSADESLTHFQSQVFLGGHVLAPIPLQWQPFSRAAALPLLTVHPEQENWCSEFLPVHSLLRVPETWLGVDGYASALYLGLNLVLFYYLLRKLWPHQPSRAAIGVLLFATFPQVLIMSMSSYAMETHALLGTIWLLLYVSKNDKLFLLTPWVGVLCIGIHQPHIHPLLAAPFVLALALQRRFFEFLYFCAVYCGGILFWFGYVYLIRASTVGGGLLDKFGFTPYLQMLIQSGNVALLVDWSPLLLAPLFVAGVLTLRRKDTFIVCCLISVSLLAALYLAWPTQGHGWGDRFLYPAIPFVIIVSLHGWGVVRQALDRRAAMNLLVFSTIFVLAVSLPYRLSEVYLFQSTHRAVHDIIATTDTDVVLLDAVSIWYGRDFVQNNPSLTNRPVVLSLTTMAPAQLAQLKQKNLRLKMLSAENFRATGQPTGFVQEQD